MLVVNVPVLSEQMTEVQPRVSTDGKDLKNNEKLEISYQVVIHMMFSMTVSIRVKLKKVQDIDFFYLLIR